jgi:hypothetical protein
MQQPMGMKKAKLMKMFENLSVAVAVAALPFDSLVFNKGSNILANMLNATKDLVVAFKTNASLKHNELRMRTHDKWMKMATMYMSCGKQDMALMMMQKIQDDNNQAVSNSSSPTRTIARAALCPAFMDVSAGERPSQMRLKLWQQSRRKTIKLQQQQSRSTEKMRKVIEEATPATPAEF